MPYPTYLEVQAGVRYWEDATVNGTEDADGTLIPLRNGDKWCPVIELQTGRVLNWPANVTADIHYKVCDDGDYSLLADDRRVIASIDGYVPEILSPKSPGYGDYVIMNVGPDGVIAGFRVVLDEWQRAKSPAPTGRPKL